MKGIRLGFDKLAEDSEVVQPEEKAYETTVTCISDCQFSQNPEKTCMLKSITLQMSNGKAPIFSCGQYSPVAQQEEMLDSNISPENKGELQKRDQLGLAGAKKSS